MQAVKIGNAISLYSDSALPEQYKNMAVYVDSVPEKPTDCACHLDIVNGELMWVLDSVPTPTTEDRVTELEAENKLLTAQIEAQSDQLDFYEDCIAEMASIVYA